jgi:hypothetical protein
MESLITITCDRCKREIAGSESPAYTKGFYRIYEGNRWSPFADTGEAVLCDACMKTDARYIAIYGCTPTMRAIIHSVA